MKGQKIIIGVLVTLTVVMLGASVGILGGYYLKTHGDVAEAEEIMKIRESESAVEPANQQEAQEAVAQQTEEKKLPTAELMISKDLTELQQALDLWKLVVEQVYGGGLTDEEAGKLLYELSSENYRKNLPEHFSILRLKVVRNQRGIKDNPLMDVTFKTTIHKDWVYVDVTETYAKQQEVYAIKLVNENNQWRFDAQLSK